LTTTEAFFSGLDVEDDAGSTAKESVRAKGTELAIAGFVLSILWLFWLGSIAGACLGFIAYRKIALERGDEGEAAPSWAGKLAVAAIAIGGLLTLFALALVVLQGLHVLDITAACHPAVTGDTCRLIVRR
jgi:hypothetical protein